MGVMAVLDRMCAKSALLETMVDHLSLRGAMAETADAAGVMRRATVRCLSCGHPQACKVWLEENQYADEAPGYCRNHDLFERLKKQTEAATGTAS